MSTRASGTVPLNTAAASSAVKVSTLAEIFIEQNFGPHMEQKCASLKPSSGSVSSCMERAVSGSSESANCSFQSKRVAGARKRVVAVAGAGAMARDIGGVRGDLVGDDAGLHVVAVGQAEMLLGRDVAEHRRAVPADHGRADGAK